MTSPKSTSPIQPLFQATGLDIASLNAAASPSLPDGFTVERITNGAADQIYQWTGTQWEDQFTLSPVSFTSINGMVRFINPATYDVEFVW